MGLVYNQLFQENKSWLASHQLCWNPFQQDSWNILSMSTLKNGNLVSDFQSWNKEKFGISVDTKVIICKHTRHLQYHSGLVFLKTISPDEEIFHLRFAHFSAPCHAISSPSPCYLLLPALCCSSILQVVPTLRFGRTRFRILCAEE